MSLATFDFDGTLIEGDAGVLFARHMLAKGYLEALTEGSISTRVARLTQRNWDAARLAYQHVNLNARYKWGELDREGMVQQAYTGFRGLDRELIEEEMQAFARDKLPRRLRDHVVAQLEHHLDQGDHVVVLSTGLHGLIWPLRDVLDLDFEVVACRLKHRDGELTGTAEGPMSGAQKATRMVAIARRRGHDLKDAYAYADHENDAHVLELVGHPFAVHPTDELRRKARRRGWPILWNG